MASTNTPSVRWVVGDTEGLNENNEVVDIPTPFFQSTATAAPTGSPESSNIYITSEDKVYLWNGAAWVGPYVTGT